MLEVSPMQYREFRIEYVSTGKSRSNLEIYTEKQHHCNDLTASDSVLRASNNVAFAAFRLKLLYQMYVGVNRSGFIRDSSGVIRPSRFYKLNQGCGWVQTTRLPTIESLRIFRILLSITTAKSEGAS